MSLRPLVVVYCMGLCAMTLALSGCNKQGGGEGASCRQPKDCKHGFRCENDRCVGGKESACNYLQRCIPKLSFEDKETLFGQTAGMLVKSLNEAPQEAFCAAQLNLIAQMGRMVVLNRKCGPRVTQ